MKAFADWRKRYHRSKCCCKSQSQPWFATCQSKTKSYPLCRSWWQSTRLMLLCGQCTRWQTAGRPERCTNTGHRDKSFGLAEISSTSPPKACRRSVPSVCLQLAGDRPVVLFSIDRTEQLPAPLCCVSDVHKLLKSLSDS